MVFTKKFTAILLGMLMVLSLIGCSTKKEQPSVGTDGEKVTESLGKDENATSNKETTANTEKTKIVVWSKNRHDADLINKKVEEYNAGNADNIVIDYQIYTENYEQAIDMAFQSGEAPDIIAHTPPAFLKYYNSGKWADLSQFMDDDFKKTFSSVVVPGMNEFDGEVYFIPTSGTTGRLFYNKNIFDKAGIANPPTTLEEMVEDARIITEKLSGEGIYGFAAPLKSPTAAFARALSFQAQRGLGLSQGYDFSAGQYDFGKYAPIIKAWKELMSKDIAFPGCESLDIDPLRTQFAAGKIGMYISYTHAEPGVYANQFPMTDAWGVAQIPVTDGNVAGAQGYTPSGSYLLNADSENLEASWKVYKAIFADMDFLTEYYEKGLGISIVEDVIAQSQPAQVYIDNQELLIGSSDSIWPLTPQERNSSSFIVEGTDMYTTFSALVLGDVDIDKGLQDLSDRYNAALNAGIKEGSITEVKIENFDPINPSK